MAKKKKDDDQLDDSDLPNNDYDNNPKKKEKGKPLSQRQEHIEEQEPPPEKEKERIKYNLVKHIYNITEGEKHSVKITIGSWGAGEKKVSIRKWKSIEGKMVPTKGIDLTWEQLECIITEGIIEKAKEALSDVMDEDETAKRSSKKKKKKEEE